MLHLMLGPSNLEFNINQGILFIVGAFAQVFWIIPMIRRWGRPWYAIGIGGTAVFIALFFITRVPGNPITGRGRPVDNPVAITIEVMQAAFIGLAAAIMVHEGRRKKQMIEVATGSHLVKNNAHTTITVGIAAAVVLAGLFVLPMTMPRPAGGPPGSGGAPLAGQPQIGSLTQTEASTNQSCTLTPSLIEVEGTPKQTEGPYFVDGMPNRSDIMRETRLTARW
jgi:hypothetical protein